MDNFEALKKAMPLIEAEVQKKAQLDKEIAELKTELELERKRATNRATRAAAAEAAVALAIVLNVFHLFHSVKPSEADLLRE